jgi:hypothetical protein
VLVSACEMEVQVLNGTLHSTVNRKSPCLCGQTGGIKLCVFLLLIFMFRSYAVDIRDAITLLFFVHSRPSMACTVLPRSSACTSREDAISRHRLLGGSLQMCASRTQLKAF